jgi:HNH endonuclease
VNSRNHIPVATKRAAWKRAKGHCEQCGNNLIERSIVNVPAEKIRYFVHLWNGHNCWSCHSPGRILEVTDSQNGACRYLDSDNERKLGEAVRKRFPFFRPDYSYTMEMSYYANHCEKCGAMQGDHFLLLWLVESGRGDAPDLVESIPEVVEWESACSYPTRRFLPFQIHHRNNDPSDAALDNLEILCPPCHRSKHSVRDATDQRN